MVGKSTSTLRYMDAAVRRNEGKLCFIKRKSKDLVSNYRIFRKKNVSFFLRIGRDRIKTCGLSFETPLLFSASSRFFGKDARPFAHGVTHCFLIRTALRANGHAPAYRALSEFEILAFTLHLHPQVVDSVCVVGEGRAFFRLHPVKETGV